MLVAIRSHIFAVAITICLGPVVHAEPLQGPPDEPIFVISREDIGQETIGDLFKPFLEVVQPPGITIVDIDEATLVTDTIDGQKNVSNRLTRIRYVSDPAKNLLHFCRVFEDDSPSAESKEPSIDFGGRDSRSSRAAKAAEIKALLLKQRRNPKLVSGAMILTESKCFAKKLKDESASDLSEKLGKRVAGFIPVMHMPVMTAADALFGYSNPTEVVKAYSNLTADRIEVFEDGSHRILWALMNGRAERGILFSKAKGMLPVLLEDWVIEKNDSDLGETQTGKRSRLMAKTVTNWETDASGQLVIGRVYAKYSGMHAASTGIVSNFSYEKLKPKKGADYFSPGSLGFVLPSATAGTPETNSKLNVGSK